MHSPKLWLSGHMSQRRFVVWVWRGYKGPRTVRLIYSFSYQESSPKYGAWILITALCPHQTQPLAHEPFWPTRGISFKGTCTVMIWNPTSLGCYSKPDLHQILLQDVEGSSAGRRSPHEHPGLLQCSATLCQPHPWLHNSYIPPPSSHHACISTT